MLRAWIPGGATRRPRRLCTASAPSRGGDINVDPLDPASPASTVRGRHLDGHRCTRAWRGRGAGDGGQDLGRPSVQQDLGAGDGGAHTAEQESGSPQVDQPIRRRQSVPDQAPAVSAGRIRAQQGPIATLLARFKAHLLDLAVRIGHAGLDLDGAGVEDGPAAGDEGQAWPGPAWRAGQLQRHAAGLAQDIAHGAGHDGVALGRPALAVADPDRGMLDAGHDGEGQDGCQALAAEGRAVPGVRTVPDLARRDVHGVVVYLAEGAAGPDLDAGQRWIGVHDAQDAGVIVDEQVDAGYVLAPGVQMDLEFKGIANLVGARCRAQGQARGRRASGQALPAVSGGGSGRLAG